MMYALIVPLEKQERFSDHACKQNRWLLFRERSESSFLDQQYRKTASMLCHHGRTALLGLTIWT